MSANINEIKEAFNTLCQKYPELNSIKVEFDDLVQKIQSKEIILEIISLKTIIEYLKEQIIIQQNLPKLRQKCKDIQAKKDKNSQNYKEKIIDNDTYHSTLIENNTELDDLKGDIHDINKNLQPEVAKLNEAKLIFIGNSGVGKTTLRENLIDSNYGLTSHDSTGGLEVKTWNVKDIKAFENQIEILKGIENLNINIWDFGGQGKYRAIQQFFCTPQSIYIFVTTPDEQQKNQTEEYLGFEYWLNFVSALGYDTDKKQQSPIIYVQNKIDEWNPPPSIDTYKVKKAFGNVIRFENTSCGTKEGLLHLKISILECLSKINIFKDVLSKTWIETFSDFKQDKTRDYIIKEEFITAISNKQQGKNIEDINKVVDVFIKYLVYSGLILKYESNGLKNLLILNPNWGRKLAYKIFDNELIYNGFCSKDNIYKKLDTEDEKKYAILLLKQFNFCHEIKKESKYIFPTLFHRRKPKSFLNLDNETDIVKCEFIFEPFMPPNLISQLMVQEYKCIWKYNKRWKNGVIFKYPQKNETNEVTLAILTSDWKNKKIFVQIKGNNYLKALIHINNAIFDLLQSINNKVPTINLSYDNIVTIKDRKKTQNVYLFEEEKAELNKFFESTISRLAKQLNFNSINIDETDRKYVVKDIDILYIHACPKSFPLINPEEEHKIIKDSINQAAIIGINNINIEFDKVFFKTQKSNLATQLKNNINDKTCYLHITAHGEIDETENYLCFEDNNGKLKELTIADLEYIFVNELPQKPRIVLFSACHSYKFAETLAKYVPYTIGMAGAILIKAAHVFSGHFYEQIFIKGENDIKKIFEEAIEKIKNKSFLPQASSKDNEKEMPTHTIPQLYIQSNSEIKSNHKQIHYIKK